MAKRRLTQNQKRRISALQDSRLEDLASDKIPFIQDLSLKAPESGLLIVRHGVKALVEDEEGSVHSCYMRQNLEPPVAGDQIVFCRSVQGLGVITAVKARRSVIARLDADERLRPLAANVDQILIVVALKPEPSMEIIDRYLVAAQALKISPMIVFNKIDLPDPHQTLTTLRQLYESLGYAVISTSSVKGQGMAQLQALLVDHSSIFLGQSGVGKSSLIQALAPELSLAIGAISENTELGKHTTTSAQLYHFKQGGNFIDSPGVRRFNLWPMTQSDIFRGFIEFKPYEGQCKFRDCQHLNEPKCSLQEAIQAGKIDPRRLASFHHLLTMYGTKK